MDEGNRLTRLCPVILSAEEFEQKAADLAQVTVEIADLAAEKKAVSAGFKARLEELVKQQALLSFVVSKRAETREVECEERVDIDRRMVDIVRTDTGEVIDQRGITARDVQAALKFPPLEQVTGETSETGES